MFRKICWVTLFLFLIALLMSSDIFDGYDDLRADWPSPSIAVQPDPTASPTPTARAVVQPMDPITITINMSESPTPDALSLYIESRFGVRFGHRTANESDWDAQMSAWLASGTLPDVLMLPMELADLARVKSWVQRGLVLPLDLSGTPTLQKRQAEIPAATALRVEGKTYALLLASGLPQIARGVAFEGYMYRRDWAKLTGLYRAGDLYTNEEFLGIMAACTPRNPDGLGGATTYGLAARYHDAGESLNLRIAGQRLSGGAWDTVLDAGGARVWRPTTAEYRDAVQRTLELGDMGYLAPNCLSERDLGPSLFRAGRTAFYLLTDGADAYDDIVSDMQGRGVIGSEADVGMAYIRGADGRLSMRQESGYRAGMLLTRSADTEGWNRMLRLLEWLETPEGQLFRLYGIEGKDYRVDAQGNAECLWPVRNGTARSPYLASAHPELTWMGRLWVPAPETKNYALLELERLSLYARNVARVEAWDITQLADTQQTANLRQAAAEVRGMLAELLRNDHGASTEQRMAQWDTFVRKTERGVRDEVTNLRETLDSVGK